MNTTQQAVLAEIRAHIDAIDGEILALLAQRQEYVAQAGKLKPKHDAAAIAAPERVAQILAARRQQAKAIGLSPDVAEAVWQAMISAFIAYETNINRAH